MIEDNHSGKNHEKEEHEVEDIVTSLMIQAVSDKGVDYWQTHQKIWILQTWTRNDRQYFILTKFEE